MALIGATLARAHDPARATDEPEMGERVAAPVLLSGALEALERQLGQPFPALLAQLYTEVGDGGFGPGYGLIPAQEAVERALAWTSQTTPHILPFASWGCTVYSVIDLASGRVGILDLDAVDGDTLPAEAAWWQADDLEAYWQMWLAGDNLFFPLKDDE